MLKVMSILDKTNLLKILKFIQKSMTMPILIIQLKILKTKRHKRDTEHLETISNKSAIKEMKEDIKNNSHKNDTESTNDDFQFF